MYQHWGRSIQGVQVFLLYLCMLDQTFPLYWHEPRKRVHEDGRLETDSSIRLQFVTF